MDLLAKRYASPFLILDEFIRLQQLHNFVIEIMSKIAEEKTHNARWDVWLHKVYSDMSFEEYVRLCENTQAKDKTMSHEDIGNIINDSKKMLIGFKPE